MAMVFCRGCAKEIHETAPGCPNCGATQPVPPQRPSDTLATASPWLSITSLILGIICVLALFDDSDWDTDTLLGMAIFASTGLVMGTISIHQKKPGNNMAIAGVIMSAISLLALISLAT